MAQSSKIEWTDATWNPVVGCSKTSPGCEHCYAERMAWRLAHNPATPEYRGVVEKGRWNSLTRMVSERLVEPLRWRKSRMVFVCSMGDLFHESVPDGWVYEAFGIMALARQHIFQVLTKRPRRMQEYLASFKGRVDIVAAANCINDNLKLGVSTEAIQWPLPNVWLGVTAENQRCADERIPLLLQTPAAVHFVSCEPLLGPIDFKWRTDSKPCSHPGCLSHTSHACEGCGRIGGRVGIGWVVAGFESGPQARPGHSDWARKLRDDCQAAGVPFFWKQNGEWEHSSECVGSHTIKCRRHYWADGTYSARVGRKRAGRLLDGREWNEMPTPRFVMGGQG
jgi:protein gp37